MSRAHVAIALGCVLAGFGVLVACSLNPQPLPPDNPDASSMGADGAGGGMDGTFGDAGTFADAAQPNGNDAEAGADAAGDASEDAASDASTDAPLDSSDDGAADAADASGD
jgi:hypothetical protein